MTSFKRWFGAGAIVLVVLALVACPSLVPDSVGAIDDMTFEHDDKTARTVEDLGRFFSGVDQNATYKGASDKDTVATASATGTTLTVTPKGAGTATVTVTATAANGRDAAQQTFKVTVKAAPPPTPQPNRPPTLRTIHDMESLVVGTSRTVDLMDYAEDADGDALTFTATSSAPGTATASPPGTGSETTIMGLDPGMVTITVTVMDGDGASDSGSFEVTVTAVNSSPQPSDIPDVSLKVAEVSDPPIDLSDYYWDPEDEELMYNVVRVSNADVATAAIDGSMLTITAKAVGRSLITVSATDDVNEAVPQTFTVMVGSRSPVARTGVSTDVTLSMEEGSMTTDPPLNLMLYFEDPDGDMLTFAISDAGDATVATAVIDGSTLTITAKGAGDTDITVTADDEDMDNDTASQTFSVTVHAMMPPPNNPPMRNDMAAPTVSLVLEDDPSEELDASDYFMDADGDTLTYTTMSSDTGKATASDPDADGMFTITAVEAGTATITVTASDDNGGSAMMKIMVTVTAAGNMKPRAKMTLPNLKIQIVDEEASVDTTTIPAKTGTDNDRRVSATDPGDAADNKTIDLSMYFEDPDGVLLFFKVTKTENPEDDDNKPVIDLHSMEATITVAASGMAPDGTDNDAKMIVIEPRNPGTAMVKVTAIDNRKKEHTETFMVTVVAGGTNGPPTNGVDSAGTATESDTVLPDLDEAATEDNNKRLTIGESREVIKDQNISVYFDDPDFLNGDSLKLSLRYFPAGTTTTTGVDEVDKDKVGVTESWSTRTWDGTPGTKLTLSLSFDKGTPVDDANSGYVVALTATDMYEQSFEHLFTVRVNHSPKAQGPQDDPETLEDEDGYMDLGYSTASEDTEALGDPHPIPLVEAETGYFSDGDGNTDITQCRITGFTGDAVKFTISNTTAGEQTLSLNPGKLGDASVTVECLDTFGKKSGPSTLDVKVTHVIGTNSQR